MCFIYTIKHYSAIKKNEIIPFAATWVDLQIFNLSKSEREKTSITWYHLYVASQIWHEETYLQYRSRLTDVEGRLEAATRRRGLVTRTESLGFSRCEVIYTGWRDKKILLYSRENYMQYSEKTSIRKTQKKSIY